MKLVQIAQQVEVQPGLPSKPLSQKKDRKGKRGEGKEEQICVSVHKCKVTQWLLHPRQCGILIAAAIPTPVKTTSKYKANKEKTKTLKTHERCFIITDSKDI